MNRVAIALTLCAVAVLPLHAQRMGSAGGFRGGFAGRPAGGFGRVATMPRPGFGMRGVPIAVPPGTRVTQIPGFRRFGFVPGLPPGTRVAQFGFPFGFGNNGFGFFFNSNPFFRNHFCFSNPSFCRQFFFNGFGGFNPFFNGFGGFNPFFSGFGGFNPFFSGFGFPWWGGWGGWGLPSYIGNGYSYDSSAAQMAAMTNQQSLQSMQDQIDRLREEQLMARDEEAQQAVPPPAPAQQSAKPEPERPATVLVFRDQHRIEVHNYAITDDTLYELDPDARQKITLAELDLPATIAANEQRGIEFRVPKTGATRP